MTGASALWRYGFTGGTIKEAVVDVSGERYFDLEREAPAVMKRE